MQHDIEAQNKALVRRVFEELDKKNFDIIDEIWAPDYAGHMPSTSEPITREEQKQAIASFYAAFPDVLHRLTEAMAGALILNS